MLTNLHVKNLALIEEADISLQEGLNILTGETGAGKSILLGAINLALGGKFDKEMLRHGAEQALVELTFSGDFSEELKRICVQEEVPLEGEEICISRRMSVGKSVYRINGEIVVARVVKAVAEELIDIHGQHEHQSLLKKAKHLEILDEYAGEELEKIAKEVSLLYASRRDLQKKLEEDSLDEHAKKREQDLLQYEIDEIENAGLKIGEDAELETLNKKMSNSRKLSQAAQEARELLDGDRIGAGEMISQAVRSVRGLADYDEKMGEIEALLIDIEGLVSDARKELADYIESMEWDEEAFSLMQERLNEINRLKDKYGWEIPDILKELEKRKERLEDLNHYDEMREKLQTQLTEVNKKLQEKADRLTAVRQKAAKGLQEVLTKALEQLNFLTVQFEIAIRKEDITAKGQDDVEFMISTNPGEAVRGLGMVASGGELSRVMLAIKTVLAGKDQIDTLIFDEIDTGISGKTAFKVAGAMASVAKKHQVICITHLPQIASMADAHYEIQKGEKDGTTLTTIQKLSEEESLKELGRLLGMDEASETAISNAREMKEQANRQKLQIG